MVRLPWLWFAAALFTVTACADTNSRRSQSSDLTQAFPATQEGGSLVWSEKLTEIEVIRRKAGIAGVGIALVSRNDILFAGGLGVESHDADRPVTKDTLFRLGSITKSFTGLVALQRQRSNTRLFSAPVNTFIPGLLNSHKGGDVVTLPELLEHTAGLSDLSRKEFSFQGERVTYQEAVAIDPGSRRLSWPPGKHSSYSNAGYGYAGYVLETEAAEPYEHLVRDHVLQPLGMNKAGFFITSDSPSLAAGYDTDGKTPIPYWHMIYRSFGGLNATSGDMALFVKALLQPAGVDAMFKTEQERRTFENPSTTLAARAGLRYGYGLGNYHWFSNGKRFHGHGGDADGYLSHYGYSAEAGYGYFVVINAFNKKPLNEIRKVLETYIAELPRVNSGASNQAQRLAVNTVKLTGERLAKLAGQYVEVTRRFGVLPTSAKPELEIRIKEGQLQTRLRGNQLPLTAVSDSLFRRPWQPDATYAFVTTANGDVYLQGDMGNFKQVRQPAQ